MLKRAKIKRIRLIRKGSGALKTKNAKETKTKLIHNATPPLRGRLPCGKFFCRDETPTKTELIKEEIKKILAINIILPPPVSGSCNGILYRHERPFPVW